MASKTFLRIGAAAGVVGLTGGAWFAGRQVRSPSEAAATANPPVASRITAPVEERELSSTVLVRGVVRYGDPRSVVLAASAVKTTGSASTGATSIVSTAPERGAELPEGSAALAVGGRPVFVFAGKVPAYRDLRPGDVGDDVRQLEEALQRLAMRPGAVDGKFDSATEAAVERWYVSKGYNAFGPTEAQRTQLRTLRDTLSRAEDSVAGSRRNLEVAQRSTNGDKLAPAREAVRVANERITTATTDTNRDITKADMEIDARMSALELAERSVVLAQQAQQRTQRESTDSAPVADAEDAVATARSQLRQAKSSLDDALAQLPLSEAAIPDAKASLEQAKKDLELSKRTFTTIAQPDVGAIIVQDNSASIRQAEATVRQADASLRQVEGNLTSAKRAVESRQLAVADAERAVGRAEASIGRARQSISDRATGVAEADQRVATAVADRDRARRDLSLAETTREDAQRTGAVALRQAKGSLAVALAQLRDAGVSTDVRLSTQQLRSAEDSARRALNELSDVERQVGIVVPANEILFFPSLPLRVDEVKALRGDVVAGPVMTVTTARLAVDSSVDVSEAKLIKKGAAATIESTEFNVTLEGTVTDIASTAGTKGVDPGKVYLEVTPVEGAKTDVDPKDLNGSSVKLTIPIRSTGKAVLAVPVAAVSVAADGSSRVEVEDNPDQPTRFQTVRSGLSAEGYVEIIPVDGTLKAGDQVVVGNRDSSIVEGSIEPNDESSDTRAPSEVSTSDTFTPDSASPDSATSGTATSGTATPPTPSSEATTEVKP